MRTSTRYLAANGKIKRGIDRRWTIYREYVLLQQQHTKPTKSISSADSMVKSVTVAGYEPTCGGPSGSFVAPFLRASHPVHPEWGRRTDRSVQLPLHRGLWTRDSVIRAASGSHSFSSTRRQKDETLFDDPTRSYRYVDRLSMGTTQYILVNLRERE
jgi:hypothetical protein